MQKAVDEAPKAVTHEDTTESTTTSNRAENCVRCSKPLGGNTHSTADGTVCYSCFEDDEDLEWAGVLEYELNPGGEFPISGVRAARWKNGRLEEVRLEPKDRTTGMPVLGGDYERVGMAGHRVWDREDGLEDEYDHLFEVYATASGRWLALDRDGELERANGGAE